MRSVIDDQPAIAKHTHAKEWQTSLVGDHFDFTPFAKSFDLATESLKDHVRSVC